MVLQKISYMVSAILHNCPLWCTPHCTTSHKHQHYLNRWICYRSIGYSMISWLHPWTSSQQMYAAFNNIIPNVPLWSQPIPPAKSWWWLPTCNSKTEYSYSLKIFCKYKTPNHMANLLHVAIGPTQTHHTTNHQHASLPTITNMLFVAVLCLHQIPLLTPPTATSDALSTYNTKETQPHQANRSNHAPRPPLLYLVYSLRALIRGDPQQQTPCNISYWNPCRPTVLSNLPWLHPTTTSVKSHPAKSTDLTHLHPTDPTTNQM